MKKLYSFAFTIISVVMLPWSMNAQTSFRNANTRLTMATHSGCPVAIVDFDGDGKDDIIRLDQGHIAYVEVQRTNNQFESRLLGDFGGGSQWAMAVADVDHNGYKDILAGGSNSTVKILMVNNTGTGGTFVSLPNSGFFLQNATFADFNNDGWVDVFCCDDNAASHIYLNDGAGNMLLSPSTINFDVTNTDDSGNYGSVWTDFDNDGDMDLYIAKCRQGVNDPTDGRRINVLFENDGSGNFTENAAAYNLNLGWQSWTASFGDIDNDGDLDLMITNHDHESQILQNDGTGHYSDITLATGYDITDITPIESVMEDFDNDGFTDIMVAGSSSRFYHNNGNGTFTRINGLFDTNNMESFTIGDLNHDGFIDIFASYATIYTNPTNIDDVVWMNAGNNNGFITLDLRGTLSNHGAIGASAKIYGPWGTQVREVRSGESYGTGNSAQLHFGIGQATVIDSVVINWPSGLNQTIINPEINQFITIIEGNCISPVAAISPTLSPYICTGQILTLTAPAGYNYVWSDASTLQTLDVTTGGEYNVVISQTGNNCIGVSATRTIIQDPDQTPMISAVGETEICNGGAVALNGPAGQTSYTWSNGDQNQNTSASTTGTYSLTIQGYCQQWTSAPINVTVHIVPDAVAPNVSIPNPGTATINATGTDILWYDVPNGGVPVATGPAFNTPFLSATTTYYVENSESFGGGVVPTGIPFHGGASLYSGNTTNATTFFDVTKNCTLQTVKVYTDIPGVRRIELRDALNTLLNYVDVNIVPDTQIVTLNFPLTPGTNYRLGTDPAFNQLIPGLNAVAPRLMRNNSGVAYPYVVTDGLSITGSTQGSGFYYYFYDWQVEKESLTCFSARNSVTVDVGSVGLNELNNSDISIYPNPTHSILNINLNNATNEELSVKVRDISGRIVVSTLEDVHTSQINQVLDLSHLTAGSYIVEVHQGSKNWQRRVTVN
ncbi:hypothetical protein BH11BAC2_BH11BAC2_07960 [soil metagenome]